MENTKIKSELEKMKSELININKRPIFFIGSGISRRYLGLPDWEGLLKKIAERATINYEDLKKLKSNEKIAQELEYFYFRKQTDESIQMKKRRELMRDAIADIIKQYSVDECENEKKYGEIEELKKTRPKAIITTNYDTFLENIFDNRCRRYVGQKVITGQEDSEEIDREIDEEKIDIYKIHGCISEPDSIVITKEDYDDFFEKSKYLYAKILTLFCEYPLIFMGYSISDRNIKDVLTTIVEMMSEEQLEKFAKHIWILGRSEESNKDKVNKKEIVLLNGKSLKIKCFDLYDYKEFFKTIKSVTNSQKFGELKLSVSNDVIELLIKPLYEQQDNLKVVTRELLQNSLDACKNKGVNANIVISICEKDGEIFLEIKDNGIGMNIEDIKVDFLTIAKSSKKDKQDGLVGKYGIGILSLFLIGESAEIYTMKESANLLAFQLHIVNEKKQVSWINNVDRDISKYIEEQSSGTIIRIKIKEKEKIVNIKEKKEILELLGLDGYLTKENNKITIVYKEWEHEIRRLLVDNNFYRVNDEICIYRSQWLDADKKEKLDVSIKSLYEQRNIIFFNDMISKATYKWEKYKLLKNIGVPFVVLNIKDLDKRDSEFKTTLSRNNVELTGGMSEDIAKGIYNLEIDKIADIIKSKLSAFRTNEYSIEALRKLLMQECTVFGKNADIIVKNNKLFVSVSSFFPHLEIWGNSKWKNIILKNIEDKYILYKDSYMHKSSIADMIVNYKIIGISDMYLDEYIYRATGSNNGLRKEALESILDFLKITGADNLKSSTEFWSFIKDPNNKIREIYIDKSNNGMLWFEDKYRKDCGDEYINEKVIIFESNYLPNSIDNEFKIFLNDKMKKEGLECILEAI